MRNKRSGSGRSREGGTEASAGSRARKSTGSGLADDRPIVSNGWTLLQWPAFGDRWRALATEVERLRANDPAGYRNHQATRFLALLFKKVMHDIPSDPGAKQFRQGKTMGASYIHWRRAKFGGRFRLFFRYNTRAKVIIYAWLNDETTLRKTGSRTDVYSVFRDMLQIGEPPTDWDALIDACASLPEGSLSVEPADE